MNPIVNDLRPDAVIPAMEENFVQWWRFFGRAPQAAFYDEPEIAWLHSGIPLPEYNGVIRTHLHPERSTDDVTALIAKVTHSCALPGVGMSWYITPSTQPTDMGKHLQAQGFVSSGTASGMAVDLAATRASAVSSAMPALQILRVSDAELLRQWVDVVVTSFQESEAVRQARYVGQANLGWESDSALQRYVALLDGEPVAMSALFLAGGVAGVYEVVTVPSYRRRGLATSVMLATIGAARERGYRVGVLQSSPMGEAMYRQLGYSEYCRFSHYFLGVS